MAHAGEDENTDEKFDRNLREGVKLLQQGNHPRAIGRFQVALKHKPDSAEAYYWLGLAFSDLGHHTDAADMAEKAVLADRKHAKAWLLWGQSLMYRREWEEAKKKLDQAHVLDPKNPLIAFNIGRCYYHGLQNKGMALHFFKKTLECKEHSDVRNLPSIHQQARLYAGSCYLAKDMPNAAKKVFEHVLKLSPTSVEARFRLALACRDAGEYAEAVRHLQEVLNRNPKHAEAHLHLGHLYLSHLGDPERARLHLARFYKYAPKSHPWRAKVYRYYARQAAREKAKQDDPDKATTSGEPDSDQPIYDDTPPPARRRRAVQPPPAP